MQIQINANEGILTLVGEKARFLIECLCNYGMSYKEGDLFDPTHEYELAQFGLLVYRMLEGEEIEIGDKKLN